MQNTSFPRIYINFTAILIASLPLLGKEPETTKILNFDSDIPVLATADIPEPPLRAGWPVRPGTANGGYAAVADINNDGKKEVLWGSLGKMQVYREDGSILTGWPATMEFSPTGPPTIGDIDGDGDMEIGMFSKDFNTEIGQVSIWHHTGQPFAGWPKQVTTGTRALNRDLPLVFADMDNDGFLEIIYTSGTRSGNPGSFGDTGTLHIERFTGESYPGWPITLGEERLGQIMNSPAVSDVDGDGFLDVAITTLEGLIYLYLNNGILASGWPQETGSGFSPSSPVAMADMNNDGNMEIVAFDGNGTVSIFRNSGLLLNGWPKRVGFSPSSPAFADIDGDDDLEIAFSTKDDGIVHLFHHDGNEVAGWPIQSETAVIGVVIADLNNDNELEIITTEFGKSISAWNENGVLQTELGFPINIDIPFGLDAPPLVTDLDNDGQIELIGQENVNIFVWNMGQQFNPAYTPFPEILGGNLRHSRFTLPMQIDQVSPTTAIEGESQRFTIIGDHFLKGTKVKLGETMQNTFVVSATAITFTLSEDTPVGLHNLKVENVNSGSVTYGEQLVILDKSGLPLNWELTDLNLENALREVKDNPTGDFTRDELASLSTLSFSGLNIVTLTGLEVATSLKTIDLAQNSIQKIDPLADLTAIQSLDLSSNQISDIGPLAGLTAIQSLDLSSNQISDIIALSGLVNLEILDLRMNLLDLREGSDARVIIETLQNNGTEVLFDPQNVIIDIFGGLPIEGFPGWRTSEWYLNYNVEMWPWIFHDEHGWQFVFEGAPAGVVFIWDLGLREWLFFSEDTYRWVFLFGTEDGWIWTFGDNTPNSRFFQRFEDGSLFSIPPGLIAE